MLSSGLSGPSSLPLLRGIPSSDLVAGGPTSRALPRGLDPFSDLYRDALSDPLQPPPEMPPPPRRSSSSSKVKLGEASYEELGNMLTKRVNEDLRQKDLRLQEIEAEEKAIDARLIAYQEMEAKILSMSNGDDEVIELNVGGTPMTTTRETLCLAEGSLLAGMFSGNFESGHKKDKEGRVFLDLDPPIFTKVLSYLRLSRLATSDILPPLPVVPQDLSAEYAMTVKYLGMEAFMQPMPSIFETIAKQENVPQDKLRTHGFVEITLSTNGGVPECEHEQVVGPRGFTGRSVENSFGCYPGELTIRFPKHWVSLEFMEIRARPEKLPAHMSNDWTFTHGDEKIKMHFEFSRTNHITGKLPIPKATKGPRPSADVFHWKFTNDYCIERLDLFGTITPKTDFDSDLQQLATGSAGVGVGGAGLE
mmetsp:Transcript_70347/g.153271  ORF Transcript_70347/g.153271 Transcript_70347/m.153271 type:complete len:420 (-) Transcript_70347:66-1325(-)